MQGELYVKTFYENIIPAVMDNDPEKTLMVLKAFQYSKAPESRFLIINCFEAALAIYFLDPDTIEQLWKKAQSKEYPKSWIITTIPAYSWPENHVIPKRLRARFRYDMNLQQLIFSGVMQKKDKELLLKGLTKKEHINAIESLFEQSRLLPREMTL